MPNYKEQHYIPGEGPHRLHIDPEAVVWIGDVCFAGSFFRKFSELATDRESVRLTRDPDCPEVVIIERLKDEA